MSFKKTNDFGMKTKKGNIAIQKLCNSCNSEWGVLEEIFKKGIDQTYPEIMNENQDKVLLKIKKYFEYEKTLN